MVRNNVEVHFDDVTESEFLIGLSKQNYISITEHAPALSFAEWD